MRRQRLEVDAQQLLLPPDHPQLDRRRQPRIAVKRRAHMLLAEQALERASRLVIANDADQRCLGTQRGDVARNIRRPARTLFAARNSNHRYRRLGRNALDIAKPVAVEHHVADNEHPRGRDRGTEVGEPPDRHQAAIIGKAESIRAEYCMSLLRTADAKIFQSGGTHLPRVEKVAAVEKKRQSQRAL